MDISIEKSVMRISILWICSDIHTMDMLWILRPGRNCGMVCSWLKRPRNTSEKSSLNFEVGGKRPVGIFRALKGGGFKPPARPATPNLSLKKLKKTRLTPLPLVSILVCLIGTRKRVHSLPLVQKGVNSVWHSPAQSSALLCFPLTSGRGNFRFVCRYH